jgi:hypothetical protein
MGMFIYIKDQIINRGLPADSYYYVDPNNELVEIQDKQPGDETTPINIIDLLTQEQINELQNTIDQLLNSSSNDDNLLQELQEQYLSKQTEIQSPLETKDTESINELKNEINELKIIINQLLNSNSNNNNYSKELEEEYIQKFKT